MRGQLALAVALPKTDLPLAPVGEHDIQVAILVEIHEQGIGVLPPGNGQHLHQRVRREWGYGADEHLSNEELIAEKYRGIRPAAGYPAWPDHSEKRELFDILRAPEAGITLTESFAMFPAASVSGIYLAHPESRYFDIGRIDRVQVEDYARRRGMGLSGMEHWLAPNLAYERQ